MTKTKDDKTPKAIEGDSLRIDRQNGLDPKIVKARTALRPSVKAALTTRAFAREFGELDLTALVDELAAQASLVSNGGLARVEAMLVAQAHTLEAIFHEMARRSALNMGEYINAAETYMRLALKAQSQCRATIETLGLIKNPAPVTFVRQANVAHGPQQVNNVPKTSPEEPSRARETQIQPNELLEEQRGERVDAGAAQAAVGSDSAMATVGKLDRSQDAGG